MKKSSSKSDGIPCMNSTEGITVALISSYRGCHRLYNHMILSGGGDISDEQCCNICFTNTVFPDIVGPEILVHMG